MNERLAIGLVGLLACVSCGGENPMGPSQTAMPAPPPVAPVAPPKPAAAAAVASTAPVLYDARDRGKLPAGVERNPKLAPDVEQLVLSAVSPALKARPEDCHGADDRLARVKASAVGAFTAPGTKQAAYVLTSGPCDKTGAEAIEAAHLVVVAGDKVVAEASGKTTPPPGEVPAFYGTDIGAVVDLDQDGVSEILVTVIAMGQPGGADVARVYNVVGGAIKRLWSFSGVYRDGCGAGGPGKTQAQVLHYLPGAKDWPSRFQTDQYEAVCPASGPPKPTDFQLTKGGAAPAAAPAPASAPPSTAPATPAPPTPATPPTTNPSPSPGQEASPSPVPEASPSPTASASPGS